MSARQDICVVALCIFILILQNVYGYSKGPPGKTCLSMFPKHKGRQRQVTQCPFQMTTNTSKYSPSETIQLTVSSKMPGHTLTGIEIRARPKHGDKERIVGQFIDWPTNKTKPLNCFGNEKNVMGHINNVPVTSIDLKWTAPNASVGDVEFVISFVEDFNLFWVNEIVDLSATVSVTETPAEQLSPVFEVIDWSECGKSKGCFLYPRTCSGRDCYAAVTYKTINNSVEFEMFSSQEGYVSVGFSDDKRMGDDETITCTTEEAGIGIQRGYNHIGLFNEQQFKSGLYDIQGTYKDGRLYCRFTRPLLMSMFIQSGHTSTKQFDLSRKYYLMLAWGPLMDGTDVLTTHIELPPISDRKVNFQENVVIRGSSLPVDKQIHGALMLVGWVWLISIATVIARHFKDGFKNKRICGSKLWFQIHRALAMMTWLLTLASFVLIFIVVGHLTENAKIHSYLGITVMSTSTLQIVMGFLRPKPDSKVRSIFNRGHWFLGKSTIILAVVTLFIAFNHDMIPRPQTVFANIVLGVFVGQQVLWELWFEKSKKSKSGKSSESYDMSKTANGTGTKQKQIEAENHVKPMPDNALILYMISITAVSAASLAAVFLF